MKLNKIILSTVLATTLMFGGTVLPKAENKPKEVLDHMTSAEYEFIEAQEAIATSKTLSEEKEIQSILSSNNLQPISEEEISADTIVMNFDSIEEFEQFIAEAQSPLEVSLDNQSNNNLLDLFNPQTVNAATTTFSKSQWHGASKLNLYVTATKGSNGLITKTKVWTSHTGVTLGFHWKQNQAYATLSSTKKSGKAYGHGTFSWVVFVKGIGTLFSRDITMTRSFHSQYIK